MQNLFRPGKIGSVELKNRIVMAPMGTTGLVELDGRYSQRGIDHFVARARGGVGLIETGLMAVDVEIERRALGPWSHLPRADSPIYIARLNELTDAVHEEGARIAAQLTAGFGRVARGAIANPGWAIAPSPQPCYWNPNAIARELSNEDIEKLIKSFGIAANTVRMAGFDAVEIHAHEGYLVDQFMTAIWNRRIDKYGGDLNGRLRFPLEIIASIRKAVGADFPVIFRMAGKHHTEGGREIDESRVVAKRLEAAGVDAFHVDSGCYDAWNWAHPPGYMEPGTSLIWAAAIKEVVAVPVIAVGRMGYPELAERAIAEGKADFIALGRALLADPEWPNKVKEGRVDDIRPCIGDHDGCMGRIMIEGKYLSCTVNPQTGREKELAIFPAPQKKSVLVIGGGPAGMEAARVAALRGHRVALWEKNGELGGNLIAAAVPAFKSDLRLLIQYLSGQIKKLGVKIRFHQETTPEKVKKAHPDVVILAVGARPLLPDIPIKGVTMVAATDLLLGRTKAGQDVVVVGGGAVGCETALWLARQGKRVTVLEMLGEAMADLFVANKRQLTQMMNDAGVAVFTGVRIVGATRKGLTITQSGKKKIVEADTLVAAVGLTSERGLADQLKDVPSPVHLIGDCSAPGKIQSAIWGAYKLARRI